MSQSSSHSSLFDEKQQLSFNDSQPVNDAINHSNSQFDEFIGLIEEAIVTDEFEALQTNFLKQHCQSFDQGVDSENRLSDTDLHQQYQQLVETFLIERLKESDPDFTLEALQEAIHEYLLSQSNNQSISQSIDQSTDQDYQPTELHEFLASLDDFMSFKSLMCDAYEASKRENDEGFGLTITPLQANKN